MFSWLMACLVCPVHWDQFPASHELGIIAYSYNPSTREAIRSYAKIHIANSKPAWEVREKGREEGRKGGKEGQRNRGKDGGTDTHRDKDRVGRGKGTKRTEAGCVFPDFLPQARLLSLTQPSHLTVHPRKASGCT